MEIMKMILRTFVVFTIVISVVYALTQKEVDRINSVQNYWKAGHNEITEKLERNGNYKGLLGAILKKGNKYRKNIESNDDDDIPEFFDVRKKWPNCVTISEIKDQGNCGSCWAVGVASAASDRLCIATKGRTQLNISAEQIMACCEDCVVPGHGGCDDGYPIGAWEYLQDTGVVTGGDYGSNVGCQPYEIPPTGPTSNFETPSCKKRCTNKHYSKTFNGDKHYAETSYDVQPEPEEIQREILKHGPVVASFKVYRDFFGYKNGVYVQTSWEFHGGHAVKILGWGKEDGVDYWLVANSWGKGWGDHGTFKIRRGTNECDFESYVTSGLIDK